MNRYNSPLRYPGGKHKLTPFILEIMRENNLEGGHYAEPYAGGAGVAIELLLQDAVCHVHLNDSCLPVYAFWRSIITKTEEFCRHVSDVPLTVKEWRRQKEILSRPDEFDQIDLGFSAFYLNRCNRSGILGGGLIGGLKQTGKWRMNARFPRKGLVARIKAVAQKKKAITLRNWDAEKFILTHLPSLPTKSLVYCDPPYYHRSQRLYLNNYTPKDHSRIAHVIQQDIKLPWIVSYDETQEVENLYSQRRFFSYTLWYHAAKASTGRELFVFSDALKLPSQSVVGNIDAELRTAFYGVTPPKPVRVISRRRAPLSSGS